MRLQAAWTIAGGVEAEEPVNARRAADVVGVAAGLTHASSKYTLAPQASTDLFESWQLLERHAWMNIPDHAAVLLRLLRASSRIIPGNDLVRTRTKIRLIGTSSSRQ